MLIHLHIVCIYFTLRWQSWVVAIEVLCPTKAKIFFNLALYRQRFAYHCSTVSLSQLIFYFSISVCLACTPLCLCLSLYLPISKNFQAYKQEKIGIRWSSMTHSLQFSKPLCCLGLVCQLGIRLFRNPRRWGIVTTLWLIHSLSAGLRISC